MKRTPEELEQYIHRTLRSLPARRAPFSIEQRVRAAIEARATLPWWKQSFAQWPLAARAAFIIASAGLAKLAIMGVVWGLGGVEAANVTQTVSTQFAWFKTAAAIFDGVSDFFGMVFRNLPPLWLYGGLAFLGVMYASLLGLGAAAYRTLFAQR